SSCLEYSQDVFLSSSEITSLSSRSNLSYFAKKVLEHYWLSSLEFLVLCSKVLDFHVLLLRQESGYFYSYHCFGTRKWVLFYKIFFQFYRYVMSGATKLGTYMIQTWVLWSILD
ncbi:hypothetical protein IC1_04212, partial [Bacillus cereus VD022]